MNTEGLLICCVCHKYFDQLTGERSVDLQHLYFIDTSTKDICKPCRFEIDAWDTTSKIDDKI